MKEKLTPKELQIENKITEQVRILEAKRAVKEAKKEAFRKK